MPSRQQTGNGGAVDQDLEVQMEVRLVDTDAAVRLPVCEMGGTDDRFLSSVQMTNPWRRTRNGVIGSPSPSLFPLRPTAGASRRLTNGNLGEIVVVNAEK